MPAILLILLYSLILPSSLVSALRYDLSQAAFNLNTNETAIDPLDYAGEWQNHNFTPSPSNWRMPFYTIMLDRFVNGDPSNDDANGTQYEHDLTQTGLRHGGDIKGLQDSLDYVQGMGVKVRDMHSMRWHEAMLTLPRFSILPAVLTLTNPGRPTVTALST